jgi:phosphoglycolate phosphatase
MPLITFDLDGTLIDSRRDLADSANEVLESYGASPLPIDAIVAMVGEGARVLVQRALQASGLREMPDGALERFLEIYDRRLVAHTRPYPGVVDALRSVAPRARLAVLTNKPQHHTNRLLDALGLSALFDGGILGGDTSYGRKPDPAGLISLMASAGTSPADTLMVGDSSVDLETARRAGTRLCLALYGFAGLSEADGLAAQALVAREPTDIGACLDAFLSARVDASKPI